MRSPVDVNDVAIRRWPIISGPVALCFLAMARNCAASSHGALLLKATRFAAQEP